LKKPELQKEREQGKIFEREKKGSSKRGGGGELNARPMCSSAGIADVSKKKDEEDLLRTLGMRHCNNLRFSEMQPNKGLGGSGNHKVL